MEPYYKIVPYAVEENTKQRLLDLAYESDAFVDISYKISFFKLPSKLQKFNTTGLDCVCQLLIIEAIYVHLMVSLNLKSTGGMY